LSVESISGVAGAEGTQYTGVAGQELGKEEFLRLLLTQLQNQDPLDPMDNQQMIAQLAQFSTLEQMENMNEALGNGLEMDLLLGQVLNNTLSTTLIGKTVRAESSVFHLSDQEPIPLAYELQTNAEEVSASIYDRDGNLVATVEDLDGDGGRHTFSWDGKDINGDRVAAGTYIFQISATDGEGLALQATELLVGVVDGVRYTDGNASLVLGSTEIMMSDVVEVFEESEG
jgi:flagellar basal-body rod modification protein FlgD